MDIMILLNAILLVILSCFISSTNSQAIPGTPCPAVGNKPSCVCQHPDGIIDLTSLGGSGNDAPKFSDLTDPTGYKYFYNPCYTFNVIQCSNVHGCQEDIYDPSTSYDIADGGTEVMGIGTDNIPFVYYTGSDGRVTTVFLHCTESPDVKITTVGDTEEYFHYKIDISSCLVCPGGCGGAGTGTAAGVAGILLMLFLLIGIGVYIIVGVAVMKIHYHATGTDLIPNKMFWFSLPILLKEGVKFTFSPCINMIQSRKGRYDQL